MTWHCVNVYLREDRVLDEGPGSARSFTISDVEVPVKTSYLRDAVLEVESTLKSWEKWSNRIIIVFFFILSDLKIAKGFFIRDQIRKF